MDNMLYIVAGLVIVLLIAVLIMRRQKAQPTIRYPDDAQPKTKRAHTDYDTSHTSTAAGTTKFDNLTVAERFIDQQRYDKAIEVLERGLIQKPHDAKLSLKLLNVYALTTQTESFYRTYDAISAHGDAATIAQAKELRALFDQDHNQTPLQARNDIDSGNAGHAVNSDYEGLDFDIASVPKETPTLQETAASADTDSELISSAPLERAFDDSPITDDASSHNHSDAIFDLTLDDLESESFDETDDNNTHNLSVNDTSLDSHALSLEEQFDSASAATPTLSENSQENINPISEDFSLDVNSSNEASLDEVNLDEDFNLDFDEPATPESLSTDTIGIEQTDSQSTNLQEDFVLDFDDLASDSPSNSDTGISTNTIGDSELADTEQTTDASSFDFDLSLDDDSDDDEVQSGTEQDAFSLDSLVQEDIQETVNDANAFAVEEDLSSAASTDASETTPTDLESFDFDLTDTPPIEDKPSVTETTAPLMFDDETPFEDDFSLDDSILEDAATTASPVITEDKTSNTDFAAQFAADFDFVNDLDNQQITLDLAAKYLELGEYDSAKRLLSEVIAQGSSKQKAQAQSLLERTV